LYVGGAGVGGLGGLVGSGVRVGRGVFVESLIQILRSGDRAS